VEIEIPRLPLESLTIERVEEGVEDRSGGAVVWGVVGIGQCGGKLAHSFYKLGYRKAVAINTSRADLKDLPLPEEHKLWIGEEGSEGAGKDQRKGAKAVTDRSHDIFLRLGKILGDVDRVVVCTSVSGGTGGGGVETLVNLVKRYLATIGHKDAAKRVGVIAVLPTRGEVASAKVANNAWTRITRLCKVAKAGGFTPLIIVDNDKIGRLYPRLTVREFWPAVNDTVAGLFHVFNLLAAKSSEYNSFDPVDYESVLSAGGAMILGVTAVPGDRLYTDDGIALAIRDNLEKTLLAEGFDLRSAKCAATIVLGGARVFEEVPGLMNAIERAFTTLAALTGDAMVHRGVYEDNTRDDLVAYTIIGGLDEPTARLESLKRFLKL
jgi:cell division GTPase FtsZ